jgi:toxin ParE1/3/4
VSFEVLLTRDALRDLEEIIDYIAEHDAAAKAKHVLDRISEALESLESFPDRGAHPRELLALGIHEYRQIHFKPYRVVCRVAGPHVYVYLITDGRRNMQTLLARRLLGA